MPLLERTGEEGILSFCADKTGNVIMGYMADAAEKPYYFQIGVVFRKIFLHDEVAAESDGVPCHKHRDTDSHFSPPPLQRVFYQIMASIRYADKSGNIIK